MARSDRYEKSTRAKAAFQNKAKECLLANTTLAKNATEKSPEDCEEDYKQIRTCEKVAQSVGRDGWGFTGENGKCPYSWFSEVHNITHASHYAWYLRTCE